MFDMNKFNESFEKDTNDLIINMLNNNESQLNKLNNSTDKCTKEIAENNKSIIKKFKSFLNK